MRRTTTILATGAAIALTAATPALAAQGTLTVSGNTITNPAKGCYHGHFRPLVVDNKTDTQVVAYDSGNCQGHVVATIAPGAHRVVEFGSSVYVPR